MTLYEKIKDKLKNCPGGYFGLEVCDHWFIIDPNKDNNTYQLQICYDYRAGGKSHQIFFSSERGRSGGTSQRNQLRRQTAHHGSDDRSDVLRP